MTDRAKYPQYWFRNPFKAKLRTGVVLDACFGTLQPHSGTLAQKEATFEILEGGCKKWEILCFAMKVGRMSLIS